MSAERDYSLLRPFDLRPFDLGAAERGEAICYGHSGAPTLFVASLFQKPDVVIRDEGHPDARVFPRELLRMAPLAWIEGKPVYKGDVLCYPKFGMTFRVTGCNPRVEPGKGLEGTVITVGQSGTPAGDITWGPCHALSWPPLKVRRTVDLYQWLCRNIDSEYYISLPTSCDNPFEAIRRLDETKITVEVDDA